MRDIKNILDKWQKNLEIIILQTIAITFMGLAYTFAFCILLLLPYSLITGYEPSGEYYRNIWIFMAATVGIYNMDSAIKIHINNQN